VETKELVISLMTCLLYVSKRPSRNKSGVIPRLVGICRPTFGALPEALFHPGHGKKDQDIEKAPLRPSLFPGFYQCP